MLKDSSVRLVLNGVSGGDEKASASWWPTSDTDTYVVYGGPTDTWNAGYDYDDVTHINFGWRISAYHGNDIEARNAYVDHMQMKIYYTVPQVTRRASVIATEVKEETRRASVIPAFGAEDTRRGSVVATEVKSETRRSEVSPTVTGEDKRRSELLIISSIADDKRESNIHVMVTDGSLRRSRVWPTELINETRRAEVISAQEESITRRSEVNVGVLGEHVRSAKMAVEDILEITRRAKVAIKFWWYYEHAERRAQVSVPWPSTRRAEVHVAITDIDLRAARVTASVNEGWRRARVFVYITPYFIGDDERRAKLTTPDWSPTRRAEVTAYDGYFTGDDERRAKVGVLGGVYTRRASVTVSPVELIIDDERRAVVYAEPFAQDMRRADFGLLPW